MIFNLVLTSTFIVLVRCIPGEDLTTISNLIDRAVSERCAQNDVSRKLADLEQQLTRANNRILQLESDNQGQREEIRKWKSNTDQIINQLVTGHRHHDKTFSRMTSMLEQLEQRELRNDVTSLDQGRYVNQTDSIVYPSDAGTLTSENQTSRTRSRRQDPSHIAFTAYLSHDIAHSAPGGPVRCDATLLNDGDAYNSRTGIFTVPLSGVYLLAFSFMSHDRRTEVRLVNDGANLVDGVADPKSQESMAGNVAIVPATKGQSFWLETFFDVDGQIDSTSEVRYTTFSGTLLYEHL